MHPLIWKAGSGKLLEVDLPGPGLGIIPKAKFQELSVKVDKGDKMLFFTDGIMEQRNYEGEMFSHDRLKELFIKFCQQEEENVVESIYNEFNRFCNNSDLQDDVTLFLLEF